MSPAGKSIIVIMKRRKVSDEQKSGGQDIDYFKSAFPLGPDPDHLALLNSHERDDCIRFDEPTHTYYVNFDGTEFVTKGIISVSKLVHAYFPEFDADVAVKKMMKGRNWGPSHRYFGISATAIKKEWTETGKVASSRGTWLHGQLERYMNGFQLKAAPYADLIPLQQFFEWERLHFTGQLVPFRTEMRFWSDSSLKLTGTADLLAVNPHHPPPSECNGVLTLQIIDWKFSKEIKFDNQYQKGLGPCAHMPDCNFSHYALQQNLYRWLLETYYSNFIWQNKQYTAVHVESMQLAVFHELHGPSGLYIEVPFIHQQLQAMLDERRTFLAAAEAQTICVPLEEEAACDPTHVDNEETNVEANIDTNVDTNVEASEKANEEEASEKANEEEAS